VWPTTRQAYLIISERANKGAEESTLFLCYLLMFLMYLIHCTKSLLNLQGMKNLQNIFIQNLVFMDKAKFSFIANFYGAAWLKTV
jgi:hypothetical protein